MNESKYKRIGKRTGLEIDSNIYPALLLTYSRTGKELGWFEVEQTPGLYIETPITIDKETDLYLRMKYL